MLIENSQMRCPMIENSNVIDKVGTVVGANIKMVPYDGQAAAFGIFLHVKVDETQYDLVFPLHEGAVTYDEFGVPETKSEHCVSYKRVKKEYKRMKDEVSPKKGFARFEVVDNPMIPTLLCACGVHEWVELIGAQVTISTVELSDANDPTPIWIYLKSILEYENEKEIAKRVMISHPLYYGIVSENKELVDYVTHVAYVNNLAIFTEENCGYNI